VHRIVDLRNEPLTGHTIRRPGVEDTQGARPNPDPHLVAFITCVSDEKQYETCVRHIDALQIPSGFAIEKIGVLGAASMAQGYQRAMEASIARFKVYVHQDVYVVHRELLSELLRLFETYPRLGMVGVIGTTQLPTNGIWWVGNASQSYGRVWVYVTLAHLLRGISLSPLARQRRLRFMPLRSFVGDYMPAVAVDGLLMATQYDVPWVDPIGGFMLYDQVQSLEFIKAGLEVGIARQEAVWCVHWGPLEERSRAERRPYDAELDRLAGAFRQHYHAYLGVPARKLYREHWQGV